MINDKYRDAIALQVAGSPARYLTDTETLRLTVYNSAASVRVGLRYRRVDECGAVQHAAQRLTPATDRTISTFDVTPGAGWLLAVTTQITAGAPLEGQTFAILSIGTGSGAQFTELEVLASGALTVAKHVCWPDGGIRSPLDGAGALRTITGTTPAAGAEIAETVPTGARYELIAFRDVLTTAVAVANRIPALVIDDGVNEIYRVQPSNNEVASTTYTNNYAQGVAYLFSTPCADLPLPEGLMLGAGYRIRTVTTNLQAADQYSAIVYLVREFLEGAS